MPEMPTLGSAPKKNHLPGVIAGAALVGVLAVIAFVKSRDPAPPAAPPTAEAAALALDGGAPLAAAPTLAEVPVGNAAPAPVAADPTPGSTPSAAPSPGLPSAPAVAAVPAPPTAEGLKGFTVQVNGPLESAIIASVGKGVGAPLTQVVNRTLVWWARIPQDLVKGDTVSAVYEERSGQEPLVHGVRFTSRKLGRTFEAWLYKAEGDAFPRFYQPDGSELEERLVDSPVEGYEQITSLLRDGRKHKGVDFKTPVGTPVKATFDGEITRKNWNFRGNGNCLEVMEAGGQGRAAMYLHLSELPKGIKPGDKVKKGEVLAKSGNSGHSFAPHLHYQLMKGDKAIDPFTNQKTTRRTLPLSEWHPLEVAIGKLKKLMPTEVIAGG